MALGPSIRDWLLLVLFGGSTVAGLIMALAGEAGGYAVAAFSGGGTAIAVRLLIAHIQPREDALAVELRVTGGVPLRARRTGPILLSAGLFVMGALMVMTESGLGSVYLGLSWTVLLLGGTLLALLLGGWFPAPTIQFDPKGLRVSGGGYSYFLQWDNVDAVFPSTNSDLDVLLVRVRDVERLVGTARSADGESEVKLRKTIAANLVLFDAELAILPFQFGTNISLLSRAVRKFVADPGSRAGLVPRRRGAQVDAA